MSSNKLTMSSISFFILGLVAATVIANKTTTWDGTDSELHNSSTTMTSIITSIITTITNTNTPSIYMDTNDTKTNAIPATTARPSKNTPSIHPGTETEVATPVPGGSSESTTLQSKTTTKPGPQSDSADGTGVTILIVLLFVVLIFLTACYLVHKRRRRDSVDFSSRLDEANIPLSTMEPVGAAPQNGLTTFASTETPAKEPEEPEAKPEAKDEAQAEQKAEADGSAGEPAAESATPAPASAPAPASSEDKPKGDVAEPPAPVESTVEDKTDDEAAISNKTSVESLKETNENNSNNADFTQTKNLIFWEEVPLDCPV